MDLLFDYKPGINFTKERALRMLSEGMSQAEVCLQLKVSWRTLNAWIKSGLPVGDPELDQVSLVDGLSLRERASRNS